MRDWFHDPLIVVLAVVAVIGFVAWVIWELTDANPTVDLTLFKHRNFALGNIAFAIGYAVFFANNAAAAAVAADPARLYRHLGGAGRRAQRRRRGGADAVRRTAVGQDRRAHPRLGGVAVLRGLAYWHAVGTIRTDASVLRVRHTPLLLQGLAMSDVLRPAC